MTLASQHGGHRLTAAEYRDQLLAAISERLISVPDEDVARLGSPESLADRMVASVPRRHPYDDQFGPFYDLSAVEKILGCSRQAVHDRTNRGTLLRVKTRNGRFLYPAFQFDRDGVKLAVRGVLEVFRDAPVDGWAVAAWFTTEADSLDGRTPLSWLDDGPADPVIVLAEETVARWSAP